MAPMTKVHVLKIVFHLGAHSSDDGRLFRSVLRSREGFERVHVPASRKFRQLLRETLNILNGAAATLEVEKIVLDAILDGVSADRVILFNENLLCIPQRVVQGDALYAMAPRRFRAITGLFPSHDVSFHMALCNPAVLIATLMARATQADQQPAVEAGQALRLSWLETVSHVVQANPGIRLTLWCHEDTPLIWPEVLHAITGVPEDKELAGNWDLLHTLMDKSGFESLMAKMKAIPRLALPARREAISSHLEAYGSAEAMEVEIPLPGYTNDIVEAITERYIADCEAIAKIPGVTFITP